MIVGQAPARSAPAGARPLTGRAGRAIADAAGLQYPLEYARTFDRVNVLDEFPGRADAGGDLFPLEPARGAAIALAPELRGRFVILLGRSVARAFQMATVPMYEQRPIGLRFEHGPVYCHGHSPATLADLRGGELTWGSGRDRKSLDYPFIAVVAPHPSRVSRLWNDRDAAERARRWWSQLVTVLRSQAAAELERRLQGGA